jgi:L-lactate dehydrogenase complex protein LldG
MSPDPHHRSHGSHGSHGSREEILTRVRAALADVPTDEPAEAPDAPRGYHTRHAQGDVVGLLAENLADYRAIVHRVAAEELGEALTAALQRRGAARVVVPADLPESWRAAVPDGGVADTGLDVAELDRMDGVVTGCALAVAETGTVVLDGGAAQGRRAITLVPDYHLCVVHEEQVVAGVPEAVAALDPRRPLTWISGPSATSDIELDRVEGVHGPRTLEVLITAQGTP